MCSIMDIITIITSNTIATISNNTTITIIAIITIITITSIIAIITLIIIISGPLKPDCRKLSVLLSFSYVNKSEQWFLNITAYCYYVYYAN